VPRKCAPPPPGQPFSGQDAQFHPHPAGYTLAADGLTVHDTVTGLTWQRSPDTDGNGVLNRGDKLTLTGAKALPAKLNAATPSATCVHRVWSRTSTDQAPAALMRSSRPAGQVLAKALPRKFLRPLLREPGAIGGTPARPPPPQDIAGPSFRHPVGRHP